MKPLNGLGRRRLDPQTRKRGYTRFNNGSSALFILVRQMTPDKVLAELEGTGGKILQTSLTHEQETKLQAALNAAKPAGEA